ncbi:MAG TPA: AAA family ATPase [Solirubrobacteraceae bacterium]|nr:AAA family ATPase [Solirubrobacteraceae bacterium]
MAGERIARRVELLLADAQAALEAGEHAEADVLARAILALDPGNADAEALVDGADQRIQMTLMFCDMVGSTQLADECDPEEISSLLREYRLLCTSVIGRYGGFIEDRQGDGLLVRFGYPWVHEDDARRAVLSGLEIVRAIGDHPRELQVRIAVHTGLVVLDAGEVMGATPNEAARLQGLAAPNTVVISDATHALVRGYFHVRAKGEASLRGISRPIGVFVVVDERTTERLELDTSLTPFTGRRRELELIRESWQHACSDLAVAAGAPPAALLVSGPAGIGKSRLARESTLQFAARCKTCCCSSYHVTTSLQPFMGLLAALCGVTGSDGPAERVAKLRARVRRTSAADVEGDLPVLTAALAIPAEDSSPPVDIEATKMRVLALQSAAELLRSAAADGPLVLLIEDLHWADESSLELITMLLAAPCPGLLVVMTARPDFVAPWAQAVVRQLVLEPLAAADLERMTEHIADGGQLDGELQRELISRSDGIPLFLEELVRSRSALHADPGGGSPVPAALRDPLLARIVAPGVDLALAQTAATIGADADRELLQRVCALGDKPFQSKLANLVAAGLVSVSDAGAVRFRHDLLRDAAYETQRHSTRRGRHSRIADLLRDDGSARSPDAGELAFHLERAERYPEAIDALFAAAGTDQALGAHKEAMARLTRVLVLVEHLPTGAPRLLHELGARQLRSFSATMTGGYSAPETAHDHGRCVELCEHLGLTPELLPSLVLSWAYYTFRGDMAESRRVCTTIKRLVSDSELPSETVALAGALEGVDCFFRGAFGDAHELLRGFLGGPWVAAEAPPAGWPLPHDPCAAAAAHLLVTLSMRGEHEAGLALGARALRRAAQLPFPFGPFSVAYLNSQLAVARMLHGEYAQVAQLGEETSRLGDSHGFVLWSLSGAMQRLAAQVRLGDVSALDPLTAAVASFRELLSAELWAPYWLTELASAQISAGRQEEARTSLDEALRIADASGADFYTAETLRIRGALRCEHGDTEGMSDLRAAVEKARAQHAAALERRAARELKLQGARQPAAS